MSGVNPNNVQPKMTPFVRGVNATATDAGEFRTAIGAGTSSFDGAYGSLTGKPTLGTAAAENVGAFAAAVHTHSIADVTGLQDALDGKQAAGSYATAAQGTKADTALQPEDITSGAITAGTGDIDFDALGGLVQFVEAVNTAAPNNTVNNVSLTAVGDTTNVSVAIVPKGTGAFMLSVPDGTATGGNARGANAIDLQTSRTAATQVASRDHSIAIGNRCTPGGLRSIAIGYGATVGFFGYMAIGDGATANGTGGIAIGNESVSAAGWNSLAIGIGTLSAGNCSVGIGAYATASRANEIAFGFRHNAFDVRPGGFLLSATTTDDTPTALQLRNLNGSLNFTTRSGVVLHGTLNLTGVKSDGSAVAIYTRRIVIKNVGGTITLVESQTIGTDYEDNALTGLTISGTSPFFEVTGISSETWRWAGFFSPTCEIAYGT